MPVREGIYGLLAEFDTPDELVIAAKSAYNAGIPAHGLLLAVSD